MLLKFQFLILAWIGFVSLSEAQCKGPLQGFLNDKDEKYIQDRDACTAKIPGRSRRIKMTYCSETESICRVGGYKFQIEQAHIGGAVFDIRDQLTALFRNKTAHICLFGRIHTGFLRSNPPRLQNSFHGTLTALDKIINLPIKFCEIEKDGCSNTFPGCQDLTLFAQESGNPIQNFCSCTSLLVPDVPGDAKINVDVTYKILDILNDDLLTTPQQCEAEYDIEKLRTEKNKQTLACIKIPAKVVTPKRRKGKNVE